MIIQGPDFIMESSVNDERDSFDLQLLQHVKSKTNPRDELRIVGYGIPMLRCIDQIARNRVALKFKDEEGEDIPMTLKQYSDNVLKALEEIKLLIYGDTISK